MPGRASGVKMVGMAEIGAPISLDGVAVHPDCWCICLCYLHSAPENPEDGEMYMMSCLPRQSYSTHVETFASHLTHDHVSD